MSVAWMKFFRSHGFLAGVLVCSSCAPGLVQSKESSDRGLSGESYVALTHVVDTQARLVFYWPKDLPSTLAGTILVNGVHHATLSSGGYSLLCLAPAAMTLRISHVVGEDRDKNEARTNHRVDLQPGQTLYWRVRSPTDTVLKFETVPAALALQELSKTREQSHTISRVRAAQTCQDFGPRS